ncbi:hypothetical protein BH11ACT8_BH11ACT8_27450 [soil metagenome]
MSDHLSSLPDQARQQIDERLRAAAQVRTARAVRRRHRLQRQLGSVAERLDV